MQNPARRLVIATHNAHKTEEFRALLGGEWDVSDLTAHPGLTPPDETGDTFAENAAIKALAASEFLGPEITVVADDSGLEVDALEGQPGVHSARYAGPGAGDAANRDLLLTRMADVPLGQRAARFRCVLVLNKAGKILATVAGVVEGRIAETAFGVGGFGYDPVFIPEGYDQTFGELPSEVKNSLSHRARALRELASALP